MSDTEKARHASKETASRFLAGASRRGQLLLEIRDAALGGCECLLHDQSALDEKIWSQWLLRDFASNVVIGLGIFWLSSRLIQPFKEGGYECAFVRSHGSKRSLSQASSQVRHWTNKGERAQIGANFGVLVPFNRLFAETCTRATVKHGCFCVAKRRYLFGGLRRDDC